MEPASLRALIRRKLADGRLPQNSIPRVTGGPSNGEICDACEEPVVQHQFVMEGISMDPNQRALHFHVGCFYMWDTQRTAPGR